eukprot:Hpha_TRINITY_DN36464_c0_g1::TRINITY_DN36464_c0_g1_i1::g.20118::m.20118
MTEEVDNNVGQEVGTAEEDSSDEEENADVSTLQDIMRGLSSGNITDDSRPVSRFEFDRRPPSASKVSAMKVLGPQWDSLSIQTRLQVLERLRRLGIHEDPSAERLVDPRLDMRAPEQQQQKPSSTMRTMVEEDSSDWDDEDPSATMARKQSDEAMTRDRLTTTLKEASAAAKIAAAQLAAEEEAILMRRTPYLVRPGSKSLHQQLTEEGRPQISWEGGYNSDSDDEGKDTLKNILSKKKCV